MSETPAPEKPMAKDVILVGKKPVMSYAMAALMQLTESGTITIKARGRAISRAVDVAEIISRRLLSGSAVTREINIGTEVIGEPPKNVSTIEIKISGKPVTK